MNVIKIETKPKTFNGDLIITVDGSLDDLVYHKIDDSTIAAILDNRFYLVFVKGAPGTKIFTTFRCTNGESIYSKGDWWVGNNRDLSRGFPEETFVPVVLSDGPCRFRSMFVTQKDFDKICEKEITTKLY